MAELLVMFLVHEADDVVENEDAFDRVAEGLVLRLEPVNDEARIEELVRPPGFRRDQS